MSSEGSGSSASTQKASVRSATSLTQWQHASVERPAIEAAPAFSERWPGHTRSGSWVRSEFPMHMPDTRQHSLVVRPMAVCASGRIFHGRAHSTGGSA
eukprot:COSAG01_NODE_11068_length_2015_cov_1.523486_2_plen_98_part_00